MKDLQQEIESSNEFFLKQRFEALELLGLETRNKYELRNSQNLPIAFVAEKSSGILGMILRHFFGHWRSFSATVFDQNKRPLYHLDFPFRFFFKTLHIKDSLQHDIGRLEQRFAILRKKFDLYDSRGNLIAKVNSSFFKFWTFEFYHHGQLLGSIKKRWSGSLSEILTDRDNFKISFENNLDFQTKILILCSCIMIDVVYFETKSS